MSNNAVHAVQNTSWVCRRDAFNELSECLEFMQMHVMQIALEVPAAFTVAQSSSAPLSHSSCSSPGMQEDDGSPTYYHRQLSESSESSSVRHADIMEYKGNFLCQP